MQKRVIKVGGSLLARGSFADELGDYLQAFRSDQNVILVGGGAMVDCLRAWHQIHQLDERESHWLAVDTLDINAQLVAHLLPNSELVASYDRLSERLNSTEPGSCVFAPSGWLRELRASEPGALPENWRVTSDSISALLAKQLGLSQLIVLKSLTADSADVQELSTAGIVDELFPQYAANLEVIVDCLFAPSPLRAISK